MIMNRKEGIKMGTLIGKHWTPQDSDGNRHVIHPETQIDAVLDPVTGKPLRVQLEDIVEQLIPVDLEKRKPGFITPEMVEKFTVLAENVIVVDTVKPSFADGGFWMNIYDPTMTEIDPE